MGDKHRHIRRHLDVGGHFAVPAEIPQTVERGTSTTSHVQTSALSIQLIRVACLFDRRCRPNGVFPGYAHRFDHRPSLAAAFDGRILRQRNASSPAWPSRRKASWMTSPIKREGVPILAGHPLSKTKSRKCAIADPILPIGLFPFGS